MSYERHEDMVAPARARPELWRLVAGVLGCVAIFWVCLILLVSTIYAGAGQIRGKMLLEQIDKGDIPHAALIALLSVGFLAVGPVLLARPLHGRSPMTLFGPSARTVLDFLLTLRALAILFTILAVLPFDPAPERAMGVGAWVALLPLTLVALLIQVGAEEIAFRGYLQSELAARFRSPLVWMVLPSLVFAYGHYSPSTAGPNALSVSLIAFGFGIAAADLTARTGTLGAAIALHFATNVFSVAVVSLDGSLSGLALFVIPYGPDDPQALSPFLLTELFYLGVTWLAVRVALRV